LVPNKSQVKRSLKWIVIVNALLAAAGIVIGGSSEFVGQVHGTSFFLVITAASLVSIEQGKFRPQLKYIWHVGSGSSLVTGLVVILLIWGVPLPDALARPVGSVAVAAVAITYCAIISLIAERTRLRLACWIGAFIHSCYVWTLIWFDFNAMSGRVLALLAVAQSACSLLAVIDFIGSRRAASSNARPVQREFKYCPYCGQTELSPAANHTRCDTCGGRFHWVSAPGS
jgi:hypothetical protein